MHEFDPYAHNPDLNQSYPTIQVCKMCTLSMYRRCLSLPKNGIILGSIFCYITVCALIFKKQGQVHCLTIFFIATAEALAAQVKQENFDKGLIYPPFSNIRKISANIAANVAAKAYELGELLSDCLACSAYNALYYLLIFTLFDCFIGLASRLPRPKDLVRYAESCMYSPVYKSYL